MGYWLIFFFLNYFSFGDISKPIFPSVSKCRATAASGQRACVSMLKHLFCTNDHIHVGELLEWQILAHDSVHKRDCYHDRPLKLCLANAWILVL